MPPVNSPEFSAVQGFADFSMLPTNATERSGPLAPLPIKMVLEISNSTLAVIPLTEPPPAAFRHITVTSDIHVELEHDVTANRTDTVADRYEKY